MKRFLTALIAALSITATSHASGSLGVFHRSAPPEELQTIDLAKMSAANTHLAAILQGMANREKPRLYLTNSAMLRSSEDVWPEYYEKEYGVKFAGDIPLEEALKKYAGLFKGYVVFSEKEDWTVNVADTYCAIHDCLTVTPDQEQTALGLGLKKVEDFHGRWKNGIEATRWSFNELFPKCSKRAVASQSTDRHPLRDYLYANRIFTFYLAARGKEFSALQKLMKKLPANIPVFGYIATNAIEEFQSEIALARESKYLVASGFVSNMTVHSGIPVRPLPEIDQRPQPPDLSGKLGVVLAFSDGDNIGLQAQFYLKNKFWSHPERGGVKVAWSVAPELYELAPGLMRYYWQSRTPNDFFVVLNGAGYTHPSTYADAGYFGALSVEFMKLAGLKILWTLDPSLYFSTKKDTIAGFLDPYGGGEFLKGVLVAYTPSGLEKYWYSVPGYPPILYCKANYMETNAESLVEMIEDESENISPRGKIVFYGVSVWNIGYDDLLAIGQKYAEKENVVFLSPQEAFTIIDGWRSDW